MRRHVGLAVRKLLFLVGTKFQYTTRLGEVVDLGIVVFVREEIGGDLSVIASATSLGNAE